MNGNRGKRIPVRTTSLLAAMLMIGVCGAALYSRVVSPADAKPSSPPTVRTEALPIDPLLLSVRVLPSNSVGQVELAQGQAFMIEITDFSWSLASARVRFGDQTIPCLPSPGSQLWHGLAAVDRDQPPGEYELSTQLLTTHGLSYQGRFKLTVKKREFPKDQLKVAPDMVAPPPDAEARIREDSEEFRRIWANPSPGRFWDGPFIRPTSGRVTAGFGEHRVYNGRLTGRHGGVDLAADTGEKIVSAAAGKVVMARDCYYTGGTVVIDHGGGVFTVYCHLSIWRVAIGQMVEKGEVIGLAGATGRVTGPHLHWGARVQGVRVDPLTLLELTPWLEDQEQRLCPDRRHFIQ